MWAQRQGLGHNLGSFEDALNKLTAWLAGLGATSAGVLFRNTVGIIVNLVVMLFALFFFFRDGDAIMSRVRRILPFDRSFRDRRIAEASALIRASIIASLIVAMVQGAVGVWPLPFSVWALRSSGVS
jgi:predicted PurR-regulated permease PerM